MQKKNFKTSLSIPAQSQEALRDALRMIEDDCIADEALARNVSNSEAEIRRGEGVPQEDVFERYGV